MKVSFLKKHRNVHRFRSQNEQNITFFTQVIKNHGGYVDKYSGDEVMALFGAKVASEVDSERAIRAAIQMLSNLGRFNQYMKSQKEYSAIDKPLAFLVLRHQSFC